jgi:hypothetical protein
MTLTITDLLADIEPVVRGWIAEQIGDNANSNIPGDQFEFEFSSIGDGDIIYFDGTSLEWRNTGSIEVLPGDAISISEAGGEVVFISGTTNRIYPIAGTGGAGLLQSVWLGAPGSTQPAQVGDGFILSFHVADDNANSGYFADITTTVLDPNVSSKDGRLAVRVMVANTITEIMRWQELGTTSSQGLGIGSGSGVFTDRWIDVDGTLSAAKENFGILSSPSLGVGSQDLTAVYGRADVDAGIAATTLSAFKAKNPTIGGGGASATTGVGVYIEEQTGASNNYSLWYVPGSDKDINILSVNVTTTPTIIWDESETAFDISSGLNVAGAMTVTGATTYDGVVIIDVTSTEALLVRKNADGGDVFRVNTTDSQIEITTINGIDFIPGSDTDVDLITIGVAEVPRLSWDDSATAFNFTHDVYFVGDIWLVGTTQIKNTAGDIIFDPVVGQNVEILSDLNVKDTIPTIQLEGTETAIVQDTVIASIDFYLADVTANAAGVGARIVALGGDGFGQVTDLTFWTARLPGSTPATEKMRIMGDVAGQVVIGATTPLGQVHVDQASATGAQPVIFLDQGDVDMIIIELDVDGAPKFGWSETPNVFTLNKGLAVGDGGTTNYANFAGDGELTLFGTARVMRCFHFEPSITRLPGANPPASDEIDNFEFHRYDRGTEESSYIHWEIPHNYAAAGTVHLHFEFLVENPPVGDDEAVVMGIEYKKVSTGDVFDFTGGTASGTVTETIVDGETAYITHMTGEINLTTTGWEPMDVILFRFYRDATNVNDTYDNEGAPAANDVWVYSYHLEWLSDKLGTAT